MSRFALLAVVVVALAAAMSLPAVVEAHTMRCGDAFWALGKTQRGNKNVAWHGCQGVGGPWLRLNVLGRSGRWYSWLVHHTHTNCGVWGCRQDFTFYGPRIS